MERETSLIGRLVQLMEQRNKSRLGGAAGGGGGFLIGLALGGPIGGVIGGVVAGATTRKAIESFEAKADRPDF